MRVVSLCVCLFLATASTALAQFDSGAVVGTVRDASGAVVPGAKVTRVARQFTGRRQQFPEPQPRADVMIAHRTRRTSHFDDPRMSQPRCRMAGHVHRASAPESDVIRHADRYRTCG